MSGIAGLLRLDGRTPREGAVREMTDAMRHRGPDGIRHHDAGPFACAHAMLHTTPESLGEVQPLVEGPLVLTADARIDNRAELLPALGLAETVSDAEVISAAYRRWGTDCPRHLIGDFAFALWDGEREELFCARDHFGIRSFYYYHEPGRFFAYATEMKGLLALGEMPVKIREERIADFLVLDLSNSTSTPYEGMLRLSPASALRVSRTGTEVSPYWAPDPTREIVMESDEAYAAEFKRIFTEAVRARLRSAFPISTHLSGGMDSSSVAVVARELLRPEGKLPLDTISSQFDVVKQSDEREYYNAVIAEGDLKPHFVSLDTYGPLTEWEQASEVEDDIYTGPNHYLVWYLNKTAAEAGSRIVLDGLDGDTVVSHGTTHLTALAYEGAWAEVAAQTRAIQGLHTHDVAAPVLQAHVYPAFDQLMREKKWGAVMRAAFALRRYFGIPLRRTLFHRVLAPNLPRPVLNRLRRVRGRLPADLSGDERSVDSVISVANPAFESGLAANREDLRTPEQTFFSLRAEQVASLGPSGHTSNVTETYGRMAAQFGLEVRHPFMDLRLVEFCIALPARLRLKDGFTRWILREAMKGLLPEKVRLRPGKASMEYNFHYGVTVRDRARFDEIVGHGLEPYARYINVAEAQRLYASLTSSPQPSPYEANALWRASVLALLLAKQEPLQRPARADGGVDAESARVVPAAAE